MIKVSGCVYTDRGSGVGGVQCSREQTGSGHSLKWREWVRGSAVERKRWSEKSPVTQPPRPEESSSARQKQR